MIELGIAVVQSAIQRTESRGSHYRIDYPSSNQNFEKISTVQKLNNTFAVQFEEVS